MNCEFIRLQVRMGKEEMRRTGEIISPKSIAECIPNLSKTRIVKGKLIQKTSAELRFEAKQKLTKQRATELSPKYCLTALRHSWATNALQKGLDALTVSILMGHKDTNMLARVYQHVNHNTELLLKQAKRAAN